MKKHVTCHTQNLSLFEQQCRSRAQTNSICQALVGQLIVGFGRVAGFVDRGENIENHVIESSVIISTGNTKKWDAPYSK